MAQDESIAKRIADQNLRSLASYYQFLSAVIKNYQIALVELTTPISERKGQQLELNPSFKFSDLQDMYKPSLLEKSGSSKSVIRIYFEQLDSLTAELKFLLANFDLFDYPSLHRRIINFLTLSRAQDVREALYSYESMYVGDKPQKDNFELIINDHETCPDLKKYESNLITPAILLYQTLKFQIMQIKLMSEEFEELMTSKNLQPNS